MLIVSWKFISNKTLWFEHFELAIALLARIEWIGPIHCRHDRSNWTIFSMANDKSNKNASNVHKGQLQWFLSDFSTKFAQLGGVCVCVLLFVSHFFELKLPLCNAHFNSVLPATSTSNFPMLLHLLFECALPLSPPLSLSRLASCRSVCAYRNKL